MKTLSLTSRGTVLGQWRHFATLAAQHNFNRQFRSLRIREEMQHAHDDLYYLRGLSPAMVPVRYYR